MPDFILPSKLVPERITVRFSLASELLPRETIVSAEVTVDVATGIDPNPMSMLVGTSAISGTDVRQQIQCGLPGVVYRLTCTAVGSTGNVYQNFAVLAVLTDRGRTPPLNTYMLTSRPYPLELIEGSVSSPMFFMAKVLTWPLEGYLGGAQYVSAAIRTILHQYTGTPEGYIGASAYVSGAIHTVLRSTSMLPEGYLGSSAYVSGAITNKLVATITSPEGYISASAYVSGTIT
jgi:hypothetical protein